MNRIFGLIIVLLLLLGNITTLHAEEEGDRDCHTQHYHNSLKKVYPDYVKAQQLIERQTEQYAKQSVVMRSDKVLKIPVVFLNPYNTTSEKLTMAQVQSQLDVLNEDFRMLNADQTGQWKQAGDAKIEFVLAEKDPYGNETNGLVQRFTSNSYFNPDNKMKFARYGGVDAWPADQYLNIWVCDLRGNKMGYAQFPGGPKNTDGVVIDYAFFGRKSAKNKYGLGRTATHEVGHWMNLRHIWGDGDCSRDDYVHDTPSASYPSYGCQDGKVSCGTLDMTSNFMDYSYDRCMNLFTEGQVTRMRALFQPGGFREAILESPGLGDNNNDGEIIASEDVEEEIETFACLAPVNFIANIDGRYLTASWELQGDDAKQVSFEIKPSYSTRWFKFNLSRNKVSIAGIQSGYSYDIRITTICGDGSSSTSTEIKGLVSSSRITGNDAIRFNNPAINNLNIEWDPSQLSPENHNMGKLSIANPDDHFEKEPVQVRRIMMTDMLGRTVFDRRISEGTYYLNLNVEMMQSGLYLIQFLDGSGGPPIKTKKVVIGNIRSRGGP